MTEWRNQLRTSLDATVEGMDASELAYLALTSKIEHPVRDRLAWALHCRLEPMGYVVAREWSRADLAILRDGVPEVLLEAKAFYGFNVARGMAADHEYAKKMWEDVVKAHKLAEGVADVFILALCTTPLVPVPNELGRTVKYHGGVNKALRDFESADVVLQGAREHVTGHLSGLGPTDHVEAVRGTAFGIDVVVDAWIVGPCLLW